MIAASIRCADVVPAVLETYMVGVVHRMVLGTDAVIRQRPRATGMQIVTAMETGAASLYAISTSSLERLHAIGAYTLPPVLKVL